MKSSGTSEILALLTQENLDAPESRTAPSHSMQRIRAHSGVTTTSSVATPKSRAR
jgi:hypothetical protein